MKKRLSFILVLILVTALLPLSAFAESSLSRSETYVNPLYRDIISEDDIRSAKNNTVRLYSAQDGEYVEGLEAGAAVMREAMERRETDITVKVVTDDDDALEIIPELALEETGVPTQGDYIRWTFGGWEAEQNGYIYGGMYYLTITYAVVYYTTAQQETELGAKIDEVIAGFCFTDASTDYEKICAVYDYICAHVSYDNYTSGTLRHTAYAAMMNGRAVCQGYATLMYRMLVQLGIGCRLIPSKIHAWNIVELNGLYYNVDSTWDAGSPPGQHRYFLLSDGSFSDHPRAEDYTTAAFYAKYPMSETDFVFVAGDLNGDGTLDARDLVRLKRFVAGAAVKLAVPGDLNSDGFINAIDIIRLQKFLSRTKAL